MGKYSDAFAKGRASAKDERQKKKHQDDADHASSHCSRAHLGQTVCLSRRSEGERRFGKRRAGGQFRWRANRCRRRSDADGLKNRHAPAHPLRAIETTQIDCLRGPRRWTCLDESRWSRSEGAWQISSSEVGQNRGIVGDDADRDRSRSRIRAGRAGGQARNAGPDRAGCLGLTGGPPDLRSPRISLVSRFRRSHHCAAHSFANVGIDGAELAAAERALLT